PRAGRACGALRARAAHFHPSSARGAAAVDSADPSGAALPTLRRLRGRSGGMSDIHRSVLTVASYNIHKGQGLDGRVDLGRIAGVLEELEADLVGVQEIFRRRADALARRLGVDMHMGVTLERAEAPYGNVVLTRYPAHAARPFDLTRYEREPRGGLRVDVELPGHLLHLFNVHFGLRVRERAAPRETA